MSSERTASSEPEHIPLRHMQGMRREFAAMLENQRRNHELIAHLYAHMEAGFSRQDNAAPEVRRDIRDLRSDVLLLENNLLARHNEILAIVLRLDRMRDDEAGAGLPDA